MQVFGTATKPLISWLLPPKYRSNSNVGLSPNVSLDADFHIPLLMDTERDENGIIERTGISRILNGLPHPQSLGMLLTAPRSKIHHVWRKFDDAYMRPMFGGRGYVRLMSRRSMHIPEEDEDLENEDQN
jgi:sodium/hydrogen exchanger 8